MRWLGCVGLIFMLSACGSYSSNTQPTGSTTAEATPIGTDQVVATATPSPAPGSPVAVDTPTGVPGASATPSASANPVLDTDVASQVRGAVRGIDLNKGVDAFDLSTVAALQDARASLLRNGISIDGLNDLVTIGEQLQASSKRREQAFSTYNYYLTRYNESADRLKDVEQMRNNLQDLKAYLDTVPVPDQTQSDKDLISSYESTMANMNAAIGQLRGLQVVDMQGMVTSFRDLRKEDQGYRDTVSSLGGPENFSVRVRTDIEKVTTTLSGKV